MTRGMQWMALVATVTTLTAAGTLAGCHEAPAHAEAPDRFPVTSPLKQDTTLTREYVCQVHAIQHIELRALERGYLQGIHVDEGQRVHKGQHMFQVMPLLYQAELDKSAAEAEFADIEYRNTKSLQEGNVVSANELAMAKAKRSRAEAERDLASAHLKLTDVRAPFDGIMGRLRVRRGSLLDEGELLTTLSDNSEMWIYFNVSEAEYLAYRKTHDPDHPPTVQLRMANGEVFEHTGVVRTIEADFNNETGNIAFRATFPNPDGLLRHGETGEILMSTALPNALLIPQKATFDILDKKFVYVVDDHNVAHARPITVAEEIPHLYVIATGLTEGERIVLEGLRKVHDGQTIIPDYQDPKEVIPQLDVPAE